MSFILHVISRSDVSVGTILKRSQWLISKGITKDNYKTQLKDVESMIGKSSVSVNSRLTRAFHVIGFLRELIDEEEAPELVKLYENVIDTLKKTQMGFRMYNVKDPNFVSLEELQSKLSMVKPVVNITNRKEYKELEKYILVSLYTNTPAVRNDFYRLKIVKLVNDANYKDNFIAVNQRTVKLVLNDYKTSDTFGRAVLDVDKHTSFMIRKLLKGRQTLGYECPYLFAHIAKDSNVFEELGNPVTMVMKLKKASKDIFGTPYSCNVYRHAWETYIQLKPDYQKMTLKQRAAEHAKLLHGSNIALEYNRV